MKYNLNLNYIKKFKECFLKAIQVNILNGWH